MRTHHHIVEKAKMGKHTDSEEWEGQISFSEGKGCNVACSTCHNLAAEERAPENKIAAGLLHPWKPFRGAHENPKTSPPLS